MNYATMEEFGNEICISLMEAMGSEYKAVYKEVTKNNGVCLHGIMVSKKGSNVAPSIYIDELFEDYRHGRSFGEIVYEIINVYRQNSKEINMDMSFFTQFDRAKDRILFKFINWECNRELLDDLPHFKWNDLAVVFYYLFEDERFGKATILIRNSHLKMWNIGFDILYNKARSNMLRLVPEELIPIRQVIRDIILQSGDKYQDCTSKELFEAGDIMADAEGPAMFVLTSRDRTFGAAALLYSEAMKKLSKSLGMNLIIIPSSIHEVILVPDNNVIEKDMYKDMVRDVNDTQVEPEERLSYNIYYYNRFTEKITVM